jgi:hypothetical protein
MTTWRMRIACWIPRAKNTQTNAHRLYSTHCFSTAKIGDRRRPNVMLYVYCLTC